MSDDTITPPPESVTPPIVPRCNIEWPITNPTPADEVEGNAHHCNLAEYHIGSHWCVCGEQFANDEVG